MEMGQSFTICTASLRFLAGPAAMKLLKKILGMFIFINIILVEYKVISHDNSRHSNLLNLLKYGQR